MRKKITRAALLALGLTASIALTFNFSAHAQSVQRPALEATVLQDGLTEFVTAFHTNRQGYAAPVDDRRLLAAAIAGMVSSLDPHLAFLDKAGLAELDEGMTGKFVGVGLECHISGGVLKVAATMDDSPAARAGIRVGDVISGIDSVPVSGLSLQEVSRRIRGEAKTGLVLTVLRSGPTTAGTQPVDIALTREALKERSVRSAMLEPGYAWIRISQFQTDTVARLVNNLNALYAREPALKGLVLDLRNDPDGLVTGAIGVASAFLLPDVTGVTTRGKVPSASSTLLSRAEFHGETGIHALRALPASLKSVPLVVLVNGGSASASEIVAGALQDYQRTTVPGTQTFGKRTLQATSRLSQDSALKLTVAKYYTPTGHSIQATGITPAVIVSENADDDDFDGLFEHDADWRHHLLADQDRHSAGASIAATTSGADRNKAGGLTRDLEQARAAARARQEEAALTGNFIPLDYGSKSDFQLGQAFNFFRSLPLRTSKPAVRATVSTPSEPWQRDQSADPRQAGPPAVLAFSATQEG